MAISSRKLRRLRISSGSLLDRFDPNAYDGDGDGLVQDATRYERPATGRLARRTAPSTSGRIAGLNKYPTPIDSGITESIEDIQKRFASLDSDSENFYKEMIERGSEIDDAASMSSSISSKYNNISFFWQDEKQRKFLKLRAESKKTPRPYADYGTAKSKLPSTTFISGFEKNVSPYYEKLGFRIGPKGSKGHPTVLSPDGRVITTVSGTGNQGSAHLWALRAMLSNVAENTNPKAWEISYQSFIRNPFSEITTPDGKSVGVRKYFNNNDEKMRNHFRELVSEFYEAAWAFAGDKNIDTSDVMDFKKPSEQIQLDVLIEKDDKIKQTIASLIKSIGWVETNGKYQKTPRSADRAVIELQDILSDSKIFEDDLIDSVNSENIEKILDSIDPKLLLASKKANRYFNNRDIFDNLNDFAALDVVEFISSAVEDKTPIDEIVELVQSIGAVDENEVREYVNSLLKNKPSQSGRMSINIIKMPDEIINRARALDVNLLPTMMYDDIDNDVKWSTNSWSYNKRNVQKAGDAVIVKTDSNGKRSVLMITRKTAPFTKGLALPGGLKDPGETLEQTAAREMQEEVNISTDIADKYRYLGEITASDWDTRFYRGVKIGAIRVDVPDGTTPTARSDAKGAEWIPVEDLASGKYPIAFGHAAWLAIAFSDDKDLKDKFEVLENASRVRNQRIINEINKKRAIDGRPLFQKLGNPEDLFELTINDNVVDRKKFKFRLQPEQNLQKDLITIVQKNKGFIPKLAENLLLYRATHSEEETLKRYGLAPKELRRLINMYGRNIDAIMKVRLKERADRKKANKPTQSGSMAIPSDPKTWAADMRIYFEKSFGKNWSTETVFGSQAADIIRNVERGNYSESEYNNAINDLIDIEEFLTGVKYAEENPDNLPLDDDFDYAGEQAMYDDQEWEDYLEKLKITDPDAYEHWKSIGEEEGLGRESKTPSESNGTTRPRPKDSPPRKKQGRRSIFGRRIEEPRGRYMNTTRYYGTQKLIDKQKEQLDRFRELAQKSDWKTLHNEHFDWWIFPIDRGSAAYGDGYNVAGDNIKPLLNNGQYMANLSEAIDIYAESMGWDLKNAKWFDNLDWDKGQDPYAATYGARLYKIARSAQIFGLDDEFESFLAMIDSLRQDESLRRRIGKSDYWDDPYSFPFNNVTPGTNRKNRRFRKSKNNKRRRG